MSCKNFRHLVNAKHLEQRAANFKKMYICVRKDRASNAINAWNVRRAKLNIEDLDVRDGAIVKHGGINFDDLDLY